MRGGMGVEVVWGREGVVEAGGRVEVEVGGREMGEGRAEVGDAPATWGRGLVRAGGGRVVGLGLVGT